MKKIDSMIRFEIPGKFCIPEQSQIFLGKMNITPKSYETKMEIGYALYTDKNKAEKLIKQFIRKKTNLSAIPKKRLLAIKTSDGGNISLPYGYVDQYDIAEKLRAYKTLKKAYLEEYGQIEISTCILEKGYKPKHVEKETFTPSLVKKIMFI